MLRSFKYDKLKNRFLVIDGILVKVFFCFNSDYFFNHDSKTESKFSKLL